MTTRQILLTALLPLLASLPSGVAAQEMTQEITHEVAQAAFVPDIADTLSVSEAVTAVAAAAADGADETEKTEETVDPKNLRAKKTRIERQRHFLPVRRRIDREINKVRYVYRGEMMVGLTASYGTLSTEDADFLVVLDNINASGTIATVRPSIGYFYRDNRCFGVRFGYTHVNGKVDTGGRFDLGDSNDVSMDIPYLYTRSDNFSFGFFHRTYAGLDQAGRFGLFAELELSMSTGNSEFTYENDGELKSTFSENVQARFSFNPGAAVYIFPNVCATLSFGLGGLQYTHVTQKDADGNKIGSRSASKMRFRLNLAAINIGMNIHLWGKKKN